MPRFGVRFSTIQASPSGCRFSWHVPLSRTERRPRWSHDARRRCGTWL